MDATRYFMSLAYELSALRDSVRNFIDDNHSQTDGEWKESVSRSVLCRHLPETINVGRGFVISSSSCSKQIDVLIYDASKPVLFRDGELVFITSDAVKGIIEVKSNVYIDKLTEVVDKLADNAELINSHSSRLNEDNDLFVRLFAYNTHIHCKRTCGFLSRGKKPTQSDRLSSLISNNDENTNGREIGT